MSQRADMLRLDNLLQDLMDNVYNEEHLVRIAEQHPLR